MSIKAAHPDLNGSFTCLGNWYNLYSNPSMEDLSRTLAHVGVADRKIARSEIAQAKKQAGKWERDPVLGFLYDAANKQGDWLVTF